MTKFMIPTHQKIARQLFGETATAYAMEPADVYQALSRIALKVDQDSSDELRAEAYRKGYEDQLLDVRNRTTVMMESVHKVNMLMARSSTN